MKNKSILAIVAGGALYLYSFLVFILTYSLESDGWGIDLDGSKSMLLLMVVGLVVVAFGIISLNDFHKGNYDKYLAPYCLMLISIVGSLFFLGNGIAFCREMPADTTMLGYTANFLYSGLFVLLGVYGLFSYKQYKLEDKNNSKSKK